MIPLPLIVLALAAVGGRKRPQGGSSSTKTAPAAAASSSGSSSSSSSTRSALQAARDLAAHLDAGGSFGTAGRPSQPVAEAQRALGVPDDGIVGPRTRNAARALGVVLPLRPTTRTPTASTSSTRTAVAGRRKR